MNFLILWVNLRFFGKGGIHPQNSEIKIDLAKKLVLSGGDSKNGALSNCCQKR